MILQPLSDAEHFGEGSREHNVQYDHDAFLGKDEQKSFENLRPDESKERLAYALRLILFALVAISITSCCVSSVYLSAVQCD